MLVKVSSAALQGIEATLIQIEVHLSRGIRFSLVGLPDNAVKESHERITSALQVNGMDLPRKQIVINMAPADIRKEGTSYDLPLLVGIMTAAEYIPQSSVQECLFIGELSLDGNLQPVRGTLPIAILAKKMGYKKLVVPKENAPEASVVDGLETYGIKNIQELLEFMNRPDKRTPQPVYKYEPTLLNRENFADFSDVKGQIQVKRAIEVACAGGHNLLMIGPPGAGKTMIANCISGILPPMTLEESLETTKIHSVAGKTNSKLALLQDRPYRSPHHSISSVALIGGGAKPQPGEISLAHNGVLFLDELPEFNRSSLEVLRQPLEDGHIRISRVNYAVEYPTGIMLVASMNPCPCGYYNHPNKECICTPTQRQKYLGRVSGPLLDRIDLHIEITPVTFDHMSTQELSEGSIHIRNRVIKARQIQIERFGINNTIHCNARMTPKLIREHSTLDSVAIDLLKVAMNKLKLSARAYDRILKVSRTIADLEGKTSIEPMHIAEAIQYRTLDRGNWGN